MTDEPDNIMIIPDDADVWKCAECGCGNWKEKTDCDRCGEAKPKGKAKRIETDRTEKWPCDYPNCDCDDQFGPCWHMREAGYTHFPKIGEPSAEPDVLPNPPQPFWTDRFRAWISRTFDPKHESWT